MSELGPGEDIKFDWFNATITGCTSPAPTPWYKDRIGDVVAVQKRTYFKDGKQTGASYWANTGTAGGFNGSINREDIEPVGRSDKV